MGALLTAWQSRIPDAVREQLTRPESDGSGEDEERSGLAEIDALAEFEDMIQAVFVATNPRHVNFGVRLLSLKLREYGGASVEGTRKERESIETAAKNLRNTTSRARIIPDTDGGHAPTADTDPDGLAPIPWADRTNLAGLAPSRRTDPDS